MLWQLSLRKGLKIRGQEKHSYICSFYVFAKCMCSLRCQGIGKEENYVFQRQIVEHHIFLSSSDILLKLWRGEKLRNIFIPGDSFSADIL